MAGSSKIFMIFCLTICTCLLFVMGCNKKRIYSDPVPPGAHAPAGAKAPAPSGAKAPMPSSAQEPIETVEDASETASEKMEQAEAKALEPAQLGSELPAEASALSGKAGMLDDELIGFPMADGSSYDADLLVAGHRTLPLGSKLEVTDVATGKQVVVTVADRGPFNKSRVLDLSRAAAKVLGLEGESEVTLKVIGADLGAAKVPAEPAVATAQRAPVVAQEAPTQQDTGQDITVAQQKTAQGEPFFIQVGAFEDEANARSILSKLVQGGLTESRLVTGSGAMSRVQAGPYAGRTAAENALSKLRADYPASFIVTPD